MAKTWGFHGWNPPDAGNSLSDVTTLGGGYAQNDRRFLYGTGTATNVARGTPGPTPGWGQGAIEFLKRRRKDDRPFCLLINLVNPHDVVAYPRQATLGGYDLEAILGDANLASVTVPRSADESLADKPAVQRVLRDHWESAHPLATTHDRDGYLKFYLHLQRLVDGHVMQVLDTLEESWLSDTTMVVRLADHGEMGLAHGGLRGKEYNAYEETLRVPMIFSSKALWSKAHRAETFAALIDVLPTLSEILGVEETFGDAFRGKSLLPALEDTRASVQDEIHFTYDDVFLPDLEIPSHIRTIRTRDHKYSVYFNPGYAPGATRLEYELYRYTGDPLGSSQEVDNLAVGPRRRSIEPTWRRLHGRLSHLMEANGTRPATIAWPSAEEALRGS